MEFDSPDVEKDFPGLYASESGDGKSRKSKEDSDYSDTEHDRLSKKDLLMGKRKDKKDKSKDRGYAALEGESSPDEALDSKSPSKSKKSKTFKFTTSKSKEKREKSRDKEKPEKEPKEEEKSKEKEKIEKDDKKDKDQKKKDKDKDKKEKEKDKDKEKEKEKDKKDKSKDKDKDKKDKDKKDKKQKNPVATQISTEEVLELGYPVFGVSISIASDRSHCHDGIDLPLVVRDCIDFLQEHGLRNEHLYKVEPPKSRLLHFKRLYNSRERQTENDVLDVNTSCALLKLFLRELPEPVLTTDLIGSFEGLASSKTEDVDINDKLKQLIEQLPKCNQTLLSWIMLHFNSVVENEKFNKLSGQNLAMLLGPTMQMSHRLLLLLLKSCRTLFPGVTLIKYVPPLTSSSPKLPDTPEEIQWELRKQESLLSQLHAEMNAGFVTKKREEQLWEVQRIITQLKRKLRSFEKKQERCFEEMDQVHDTSLLKPRDRHSATPQKDATRFQHETSSPSITITDAHGTQIQKSPALTQRIEWFVDQTTGFLMLPKSHPDYYELIRLQLENQELLNWKAELQNRITSERADILRLKNMHHQAMNRHNQLNNPANPYNPIQRQPGVIEEEGSNLQPGEYDKIIEKYVRENNLLEQKKKILAKEIFDEHRECIRLQVELTLQQQY